MRQYLASIMRAGACVLALVVWQRVRMGVPVEVLVENPQLLWASAQDLKQWVK